MLGMLPVPSPPALKEQGDLHRHRERTCVSIVQVNVLQLFQNDYITVIGGWLVDRERERGNRGYL